MQSRPQKSALTCKLCSLWCITKNTSVLIYHLGHQQKQWYSDSRLPEKFNVNSVEYKKWPAWINQLNGPCEFSITQHSHFLIPHGVNIPPWQASMCDKYLLKKKKKDGGEKKKKKKHLSTPATSQLTGRLTSPYGALILTAALPYLRTHLLSSFPDKSKKKNNKMALAKLKQGPL